MRQIVKEAAEMYALKAISVEQLVDECITISELKQALKHADNYGKEYDHWLGGLEKASEYHLEEEYNYCYFKLHMTVEEALAEWDLL